jgi:hypothetical protein
VPMTACTLGSMVQKRRSGSKYIRSLFQEIYFSWLTPLKFRGWIVNRRPAVLGQDPGKNAREAPYDLALLGRIRNFSPVARRLYATIISGESASASDISDV